MGSSPGTRHRVEAPQIFAEGERGGLECLWLPLAEDGVWGRTGEESGSTAKREEIAQQISTWESGHQQWEELPSPIALPCS